MRREEEQERRKVEWVKMKLGIIKWRRRAKEAKRERVIRDAKKR